MVFSKYTTKQWRDYGIITIIDLFQFGLWHVVQKIQVRDKLQGKKINYRLVDNKYKISIYTQNSSTKYQNTK